jgi:high-affinity iron transporter
VDLTTEGPMSDRLARRLVFVTALTLAACGCVQEPASSVEEGRRLYADNGCASCHGRSGHGDGPIAANLEPKPTDFRDENAFVTGFEVAAIAASIENGISYDVPLPPGVAEAHPRHSQGMPPFPHLSELERRSLALYVMSIRNESR